MNPSDELQSLLNQAGATLLRRGKHLVYLLPDGRKFTVAATPSDYRAAANQVSDLRKLLGLKREIRKNPNKRSKKPGAPPRPIKFAPLPRTAKPDPFANFQFPSLKPQRYQDCLPIALLPVPMTPVWCWMRKLLGYGG